MLSTIFQSSTLPVLEQVVSFTQARHGVLAGNVANLDTPGYRTRDLSPELFQERLKSAVEASRAPKYTTLGRSAASTTSATRDLNAFRDVEESIKSILYHDDSDVSLERQVTEMSKNQAEHNLAISLMTAQFRLLQAAITERVV